MPESQHVGRGEIDPVTSKLFFAKSVEKRICPRRNFLAPGVKDSNFWARMPHRAKRKIRTIFSFQGIVFIKMSLLSHENYGTKL